MNLRLGSEGLVFLRSPCLGKDHSSAPCMFGMGSTETQGRGTWRWSGGPWLGVEGR